jgi:predicted site-specific integrase-resolvase
MLPASWFRPEIVNPVVHPHQGKRAAIYARYSCLGKREASIERQVEVCTEYAEANGYLVERR